MSNRPPSPSPLARSLGLVSLGLGLGSLLAPDALARRIGLDADDTTRGTLMAVGLRELAVVPSLLRGRSPRGALTARVAGDVMDLALLRRALDGRRGEDRDRLVAAGGVVVALGLLDLLARRRAGAAAPLRLTATTTVLREPQEVYAFWRRLEHLPSFMTHLERVVEDGPRSHWTAQAPVGRVEWDAEIVEDVPGEHLAWRSTGRTRVPNSGVVRFRPAPGDRGTEIRVELTYEVPAGRAGAAFARLLGEDPHQQVEDDLRRAKQVLETGDVVRSSGSPEGTKARRQLFQRPGQ